VTFPIILHVGAVRVPAHVVLEAVAYAVGFQIYRMSRARRGDPVSDSTRWTVIAAAAVGAAIGSKALFWLEDPALTLSWIRTNPALLLGGKTIVGGLLGGTAAVEIAKRSVGERRSTGDLFVLPLLAGIAIGRLGCFTGGLADHTFGTATALPWGVDFGDGIRRHPTQLYEIVFVLALAWVLWRLSTRALENGDLFKIFLIAYLSFRLLVDGIKPGSSVAGLSAIQWACAAAIGYYARFVPRMLRRSHAAGAAIA
jgi:phosphatidylglycerol---prolipoprotein diacylglyceryl transferase